MEQPIQIWNGRTGETVKILNNKLPYAGMNITGVTGMPEGQKANLKALGSIAA